MSEHFPSDTANGAGAGAGTLRTVMRLWEGKSDANRVVWLTEPPKAKIQTKPESESAKYAITLLHRDVKHTGRQILDEIIIRSPDLCEYLDEQIPNISSFYDESEQGLALHQPFRLLFWHFGSIVSAGSDDSDDLSEPARLLQGVLEDEFKDLLVKQKQMLAKDEINFDILWTLFKPGITCITAYADDVVAVKVSSIHHSTDPMGHLYYRIKYDYLGWDGDCLGWQDSYTDVMEFHGRRKVKTLNILPIEYHADTTLAEKLTSRGRKFVQIAIREPHMMSFNGEALDREVSPMWWQGEQKKKMSERVVLDARAYNHYGRRLGISKLMKRDEVRQVLGSTEDGAGLFIFCCPEFYCFALQRKKWARVWMTDLDEVVFNDSAYPSLVLPKDYKELLLAFAEAQIDGYGFDDVIAGKGQGILMLLAGPPGTGKTLTAEAMAEHMQRPLYSVAAGELGAAAGGMENELDKVLELSTRWNAVLLLDEADVFLEKRTDNDLQRNTIVSVFLRKLEYYRGIMFLTTNRAHSFDDAFKSRIHVSIRYPDLDTNARRTIWSNFLQKAKVIYEHGVDVSEAHIEDIAKLRLNGREIRNIVKSAQLLASRDKRPLSISHLETVRKVEHEDSVWNHVGISDS